MGWRGKKIPMRCYLLQIAVGPQPSSSEGSSPGPSSKPAASPATSSAAQHVTTLEDEIKQLRLAPHQEEEHEEERTFQPLSGISAAHSGRNSSKEPAPPFPEQGHGHDGSASIPEPSGARSPGCAHSMQLVSSLPGACGPSGLQPSQPADGMREDDQELLQELGLASALQGGDACNMFKSHVRVEVSITIKVRLRMTHVCMGPGNARARMLNAHIANASPTSLNCLFLCFVLSRYSFLGFVRQVNGCRLLSSLHLYFPIELLTRQVW